MFFWIASSLAMTSVPKLHKKVTMRQPFYKSDIIKKTAQINKKNNLIMIMRQPLLSRTYMLKSFFFNHFVLYLW